MPIVRSGDNVHVEYSIPKDIKDRIPDYFYFALAGELVSIFGTRILGKNEWVDFDDEGNELPTLTDEDCSYYDLCSSTGGWVEAFIETCRKLDMIWLVDYWRTLEWYDSDIFDGEIETEVVKRFCESEMNPANCYYKYLCGVTKKERENGKK